MSDFDLVVIGGGPAGYATALYGASAGLSVALVEKDKVGGTCLHRGCVPAKAFLETAYLNAKVKELSRFGINADVSSLDFAVAQERKQRVVDQLHKGLMTLMKRRKVEVIEGFGRLGASKRVIVETPEGRSELTGANVVLAPGSKPKSLPGITIDGERFLTSDEVLELSELPESVLVIGAGAVGAEFASFFADVGSQVVLIEALSQVVPGADEEASQFLARSFTRRGMQVKTGVSLGSYEVGEKISARLSDETVFEVDKCVVAVGRAPATEGLFEEGVSVELDDRGYVKVDEYMRTSEPGVFAIGDAVRTPQLAHVGFLEGMLVVHQVLGEPAEPIEYDKVPWCIYTRPELAFSGLTEKQAREIYGEDVVVSKDSLAGNSRALILGEAEGFVKLVGIKNGGRTRLLGLHVVGPWATELLMPGYLSVNWEADVEDFRSLIAPHPTLSEGLSEAWIALTGRGLHVG